MAKVSIEHISLSYDLSAVGAEECFLFLHGLQSQKETFFSLRKNLATICNILQLSIDFIGFGESDKPENFDYDASDRAIARKSGRQFMF